MNPAILSRILGLYMIAFVALALACLSTVGWTCFAPILTYLSLALMLAVGILRIRNKDTSGSAGAFAKAFRLILTQRWLVLLLLIAIALRIADGLLYFGIERHFMTSEAGQALQRKLSHGLWQMMVGPHWPSIYGFSFAVTQSIRSAANGFFPNTGIQPGKGGAFTALAVLCVLPSLRRKLEDLQRASERLSDLKLVEKLLTPTALLCILIFVCRPVFTWLEYVNMGVNDIRMNPVTLAFTQGVGVLVQISTALIGLVVSAGLMAGISGSLLRVCRQEGVTSDTFVADLVRFFKPIAGLYVLLLVVRELIFAPSWWHSFHLSRTGAISFATTSLTMTYMSFMLTAQTVLEILLMFAPFLAIAGYTRGRDLFSMGIRQWFSQWWRVWKFIAVGLAVGATIGLPVQFMQASLGRGISCIRLVEIVIAQFFEAFGSILMLCAVWAFCFRNFLTEECQHREVEGQA